MLWTHAAAAVLAAALAFGAGWRVRAWKAGSDEAQALRAAHAAAIRQADTAAQEAAAHEQTRAALQRAMRARQPAVAAALARPACPGAVAAVEPLALGAVVLPADALGRVRVAAGAADQTAGDPGQPGAAVRSGSGDP